MKKWSIGLLLLGIVCSAFLFEKAGEEWGFFGHRRINRMAVFTLPPELLGFYKNNIEYITEHAVDPDKRRYATQHEAVRHYIDLDHWGEYPFPNVPRNWIDVLIKYTDVYAVTTANDTLHLFGENQFTGIELDLEGEENVYNRFFREHILPQYYEEEWQVDCTVLNDLLAEDIDCQSAFAIDRFSEYGILPYHLAHMQYRLTEAFKAKDIKAILRLSADFGHYIGDAHVPLHTTENYNGQLTNQVGIHAFWESRIPELFADDTYDFFVGKAEYIDNPKGYFWDIVLTSHSYVDSVLLIEKELSETFPQDQQYCYEERLGRTVRVQCKAYAEAYQQRMAGMVEERMRQSVHAVGCAWYTAWVDAGQPDLRMGQSVSISATERREQESLEQQYQHGSVKGREHN